MFRRHELTDEEFALVALRMRPASKSRAWADHRTMVSGMSLDWPPAAGLPEQFSPWHMGKPPVPGRLAGSCPIGLPHPRGDPSRAEDPQPVLTMSARAATDWSAIRLGSEDAAQSNLGIALRDSGDLSGAIAACNEAISLDPRPHSRCGTGTARSPTPGRDLRQRRTVRATRR
jgi:hypothetical protein